MHDRVGVAVERRRFAVSSFQEDPFPPLTRTGSSRVYPYPMQDDVSDQMVEKEYATVVLDNGLLRVTVLPQFGGHVYSLHDLVNDREVFYLNPSLKLGLVAMRGAWWAGGIEFNFPQVGHTVTTIDPVSWHLAENEDGSATLFVGAVERLTRMQWTVGITLRPHDLRLQHSIYLFNRTPFWHRLYFWSNAAVPARDDFRFLLPATQVYSWWYGAQGVASYPVEGGRDLSRYHTHHHATDLFARDLRADWFGCYYDELDYGVLHHASRFETLGRKLWTWGDADDGLVWADLLSEGAGPYCEIQTGRFVHQGVHRLIAPRAVEAWEERWFPVWGLGGVLHASDQLVLNAARTGDRLEIRLLSLVRLQGTLHLAQGGPGGRPKGILLGPGEIHPFSLALQDEQPVRVAVTNGDGEALQVFLRVEGERVSVLHAEAPPYLDVAEGSQPPQASTPCACLLAARHHEENSQLDAAAECYRKALELDPQCAPAMNGLAQWHLKRGELEEGRRWARRALEVDPQSEDALWWLGVAAWLDPERVGEAEGIACLRALERRPTYPAAAAALLGELQMRQPAGAPVALAALERAIERNPRDSKALALAAYASRGLFGLERARAFLQRCEQVNPLEPLLWSERYFHSLGMEPPLTRLDRGAPGDDDRSPLLEELSRTVVCQPVASAFPFEGVVGEGAESYLEAACDYERIGDGGAAFQLFASLTRRLEGPHPLVLYRQAVWRWRSAKVARALALVQQAARQSPLFVLPHRLEDAQALQFVLRLRPGDGLAHYLLGTWLASVGRWQEADQHWEQAGAVAQDERLQVLIGRNRALKQWRQDRQLGPAMVAYSGLLARVPESLSEVAWRLWLERDAILAELEDHATRVELFDQAPEAVKRKAQVKVRWAEAYLRQGRPARALALLAEGDFKPWEGQVYVRQLWRDACLQLGRRAMASSDWARAREHFQAAADYPPHLHVGRPYASDDAEALFWAGWCALQEGDRGTARRFLEQAASENQPPGASSACFKTQAAQALARL